MTMRLEFFGHACVLLGASNGCRVVFDPFQPGAFRGRITLAPFCGHVDAVVSSHGHLDHYHIDPSFGAPVLVDGPGQVRGIHFSCIQVPHGAPDGIDHGTVKVFCAVADGVSVVHMGDAGRPLSRPEMDSLGRPDVLFVPVGGRFTMGPDEAASLVRLWRPGIVVPMHHSDPEVDINLAPVDEFLALMDGHVKVDEILDVDSLTRPDSTTVVVMAVSPRRRRT